MICDVGRHDEFLRAGWSLTARGAGDFTGAGRRLVRKCHLVSCFANPTLSGFAQAVLGAGL